MPVYDEFSKKIKDLIHQGCTTPDEVLGELLTEYPKLMSQSAQTLKVSQFIERGFQEVRKEKMD